MLVESKGEKSEGRQLNAEEIIEKISKANVVQILGCNPLVETLTDSQARFSIALRKRIEGLSTESVKRSGPFFTLYMESEQEDFFQQLTDSRGKAYYKLNYIDKKTKIFGDAQTDNRSALTTDIVNRIRRRYRDDGAEIPQELIDFIERNIYVRQLNLRMPYNAIQIDGEIWFYPLALDVPGIDKYIFLDAETNPEHKAIRDEISRLFKYLTMSDEDSGKEGFKQEMGGRKFTSKPDAELIEAYDEITNKRSAVFDRDAFLTLEYKRASIWGFIFNRRGQLLLHQRSQATKDNRGLWDKSVGGHVDLTDASTVETAKREFVEEVYMKDAEYSNYNLSKTEMVVDFGEWRRTLRADESFVEAFVPFTGKDKHVIMFRAYVEAEKTALTVDRDSIRQISFSKEADAKKVPKPTRFRSDVFFFITAEGEMDDDGQMAKTFAGIGSNDPSAKGAAISHRLIGIDRLREEVTGAEMKMYTDDMINIVKNYWGYLTEFSSFVKDVFERIEQKKGR